jgi:Uncharacterized protein conserved in bacteria
VTTAWRSSPSLLRRLGLVRLDKALNYFARQTGSQPGLRQQLLDSPYELPGLPEHGAMALVRPHEAALAGVGVGALSPALPSAHAPVTVSRQAVSTARLSAVDFFRGLAILEVVTHHTTAVTLRHLPEGSTAYLITAGVNRTLHFAVPAFIFLSATVLTRSLLKDFRPLRYYSRRLIRGGWPYLLWSVLYVLWYVASGRRPPEVLTDPERWSFYLLYGKASYHLYFMLVALQVYLILPLLLPLARRRPPIWLAFVLGAALQAGAYLLNRNVLQTPYPGSTVLWYVLPIVLGVSVGARLGEFSEWFRKSRWWVLGLLVLVFPPYLTVTTRQMLGESVDSVAYHALSWGYSALMALGLLGLAYQWQRSTHPLRILIATLGTVSLQVYLIHPFLLQVLENWYAPERSDPVGLTIALSVLYGLVVLMIPAVIGRLLSGRRLSTLLFGR